MLILNPIPPFSCILTPSRMFHQLCNHLEQFPCHWMDGKTQLCKPKDENVRLSSHSQNIIVA